MKQLTALMLSCVIAMTSSQQSRYEAVISSSLEAQCALDQPASSSTKVRSRIQCAKNCESDPSCSYFNIHDDSGLCQLFYWTPSNIIIQPGCRLYKIDILVDKRIETFFYLGFKINVSFVNKCMAYNFRYYPSDANLILHSIIEILVVFSAQSITLPIMQILSLTYMLLRHDIIEYNIFSRMTLHSD